MRDNRDAQKTAISFNTQSSKSFMSLLDIRLWGRGRGSHHAVDQSWATIKKQSFLIVFKL